VSSAEWAAEDAAWAKKHHVHMAGMVFGTSKGTAPLLAETFSESLLELLAQGALCYDQTVFALAFKRWPERFDLVLFDNWKSGYLHLELIFAASRI
jgi:hypothetical protein